MIALKPENVVDVLFGNRLRQLLDERNISQAHFADRIGVSRSRMNNYVAQRSEPDYATLIRIANTLDTSIDFLLGKSEHQGLPQTACLSGFPYFIPSRGAGGEPPDPSCWIPLYGSQYEAPEPDAAPAAPPIRAARTGKRPARPIRSDGFATIRCQAFPLHMKIGRLPRQISSNRVNGGTRCRYGKAPRPFSLLFPRCRSIQRLDVAGLYDGKAIQPQHRQARKSPQIAKPAHQMAIEPSPCIGRMALAVPSEGKG